MATYLDRQRPMKISGQQNITCQTRSLMYLSLSLILCSSTVLEFLVDAYYHVLKYILMNPASGSEDR